MNNLIYIFILIEGSLKSEKIHTNMTVLELKTDVTQSLPAINNLQ